MEDYLRQAEPVIEMALREDIGTGDVTSRLAVGGGVLCRGIIRAKDKGVIAGLDVAELAFLKADSSLSFRRLSSDGDRVGPGMAVAVVEGDALGVLSAERTALNFLQRMSGIASLTSRYVEAVRGTGARITDTRKTTPCLRAIEKYAVRVGGGVNHRFGLYDMVLIKDNHIAAAGGIGVAVRRIRAGLPRGMKVEIEAKGISQVREALDAGVDRIMLDNMDYGEMSEAVRIIRGFPETVEIEVSGGVSLDNVRAIAELGVDFISVGELTHSFRSLDFSLDLEPLSANHRR